MSKIKGIFIYSDYPSKSLLIAEIIDYLGGYGLSAQDRGNLFEFLNPTREERIDLGRKIAGTRIPDISTPLDEIREPIYGEISVELRRLAGGASSLGVFHDGLWLQRILYKAMAERVPDEFKNGFTHIIFTNRLFGTFEIGSFLNTIPPDGSVGSRGEFYRTLHNYPGPQRYHARVVLAGLPSLISTSGLVEAPARPKEYYWLKAGFIQGGKDIKELDLIYKGRFIEYNDPRITQILKPYTLQAVFYELTGNPFCDNPSCCLYNSHWQEEVLKVQLEGKLCGEHRDIISNC